MTEEQPQPLPVEIPREVELAGLERDLRELWTQTNGSAVVRACALNLVVVMWDEEHADALADVLAEVTVFHPARTIVVTAHPDDAESSVRTWISVRCQKPGSNRTRICHEEIRARLRGDAVKHVDNVVLPMLLADLPTFLWWQGSLPNHSDAERAFGVLAENCERLVVDSQRLASPQAELIAMALMTRDRDHRSALGDLNWHRLTSWRQMTAQCFDPPALRPLLRQLERVDVDFQDASGERVPVAVLLFVGWLARRLEWRLRGCQVDGDLTTFIYEHLSATVMVRARRVARDGNAGGCITAIRLGAPGARVDLEALGLTTLQSRVELSGRPPLSTVLPSQPLDLSSVLRMELTILSRNPIYEDALQEAETVVSRMAHDLYTA